MSTWRQWGIGGELYSSKGIQQRDLPRAVSRGTVVWPSGLRRGHTLHGDNQPRSPVKSWDRMQFHEQGGWSAVEERVHRWRS
jgi:hypothetical protein